MLDAQRRYFDAQISLSNAVRDEYLAMVALYKALGGGWQTPDGTALPDDASERDVKTATRDASRGTIHIETADPE